MSSLSHLPPPLHFNQLWLVERRQQSISFDLFSRMLLSSVAAAFLFSSDEYLWLSTVCPHSIHKSLACVNRSRVTRSVILNSCVLLMRETVKYYASRAHSPAERRRNENHFVATFGTVQFDVKQLSYGTRRPQHLLTHNRPGVLHRNNQRKRSETQLNENHENDVSTTWR